MSITCPNCGKLRFPDPYSRSSDLGEPPTIHLDGSTNFCACDPETPNEVELPPADL